MRELLKWFKESFFIWVNTKRCIGCNAKSTKNVGMVAANSDDLK